MLKKRMVILFICGLLILLLGPMEISYAEDNPEIHWISKSVGYSINEVDHTLLLKSGTTLETLSSEEDPDNIDTNYESFDDLTYTIDGKETTDNIANGDVITLTGTANSVVTTSDYTAMVIDGLDQLNSSESYATVDLMNEIVEVRDGTTVSELENAFSSLTIEIIKKAEHDGENDQVLSGSDVLETGVAVYELIATETYDGNPFDITYSIDVSVPIDPAIDYISDVYAFSVDQENNRLLLKDNVFVSDLKNTSNLHTNGLNNPSLFSENILIEGLNNGSVLSDDSNLQTGDILRLSADGLSADYEIYVISSLDQLSSGNNLTIIDQSHKKIKFVSDTTLGDLKTDLNLDLQAHYYDENNRVEINDASYIFDSSISYRLITSETYYGISWDIEYSGDTYQPILPQMTWIRSDVGHVIDGENNRLLIKSGISVADLTSDENPDHMNVNQHRFDDTITFEVKDSGGQIITDETIVEEGAQITLSADGLETTYMIYVSDSVPEVSLVDGSNFEVSGNNLWVPYGSTQEALQQGTNETLVFPHDSNGTVDNDTVGDYEEMYYPVSMNGETWDVEVFALLDLGLVLSADYIHEQERNTYRMKEGTDIADLVSVFDTFISDKNHISDYTLKKDGSVVTSGTMTSGEFYALEFTTYLGNIRYYLPVASNGGSGGGSSSSGPDTVNNSGTIKSVNLTSTNDRVLFKGDNDGYMYLKSQSTLTFDIEAFDNDGAVVDLTNSNISLTHEDAFGDDLYISVIDSDTIEIITPGVQGGYSDSYYGALTIDDFTLNMKIFNYKGSLGVIEVNNPDGSDYPNGNLGYAISYEFEDNNGNVSGDGSNTGSDVVNGELIFPIRTDYVNLYYAYIIGAPSDATMANSQVIDLTNEFNITDPVINFTTPLNLQSPSFTGTLELEDGSPWTDCGVRVSTHNTDGSSPIDYVGFSIFAHDNTFSLAPIGDTFDSSYSIDITNHNNIGLPIETSINIDTDSAKTFVPGSVQLTGTMLMPDGESIIPNGSGRDSEIFFRPTDGSEHRQSSGYRNTGAFELNGLVDGKEYEMYVHLDLGDFDDAHITDGLKYVFTYSDAGDTLEVYNPYTDQSETFNKSSFDLQVAETQLMGQVLKEGVGYNEHLDINLYDENRNWITSDTTHSSNQMNKYGVYNLGSLKETLSGDYYIEVDAPQDTIQYSGFVEKVTLPKSDSAKYAHNLNLRETRVTGQILAPGFNDTFQRVYVNIFDEYGNYVKNGRVRSDGKFAVGNLNAGRYLAKAFVSPQSSLADNYLSSEKIAFEVLDTGYTSFDLSLIELMTTETIANYQEGTWVRVFDETMTEIDALATTGGTVKIPRYSDGNYFFKAYAPDYLDSDLIPGTISNGVLTLDSTLDLTTTVDLSITLDNSQDGEVVIYDENKNFITFGETTSSQINFGGLSDGNYFVKVTPDDGSLSETTFIPISLPGDGNKTITLTAPDVTGTVTNGTTGWVYVLDENESVVSTNKINSDGSFSVSNLESNVNYKIYADSVEGYPSIKKDLTESMSTIELSLRTQASINGEISTGEGQVNIYLYDENYAPVQGTQTNDFGEFYFMDIINGNYNLVIERDNQSDYLKSISVSNNLNLGNIDIN